MTRIKLYQYTSQINEGVLKEISKSKTNLKGKKRILGFDLFKIFKPSFEKNSSEQFAESQTKVFHHDMLNVVEKDLRDLGSLYVLNSNSEEQTDFVGIAKDHFQIWYLDTEGWVVYLKIILRFNNVSLKFNELNLFINRCAITDTNVPDEIIKLETDIDKLKRQVQEIGDRNQKTNKELKKLKKYREKLRKLNFRNNGS